MPDDNCKRGFFGDAKCNFESRYDSDGPTPDQIHAMGEAYPFHNATIVGKETYVCDVCTSCGKQLARPTSPPKGPQT